MWRQVEVSRQSRIMEAMTVRVREITVGATTVAAIVTATSRERFRGQPVAQLQIKLQLAAIAEESQRVTRERVRNEALRFLDVA